MAKLTIIVLLIGFLLIFRSTYLNSKFNSPSTNLISVAIPIGAYFEKVIHPPCGFITHDEVLPFDDPKVFDNPKHYLAQLIWFGGEGFLEYKIKNPLPPETQIKTLTLFLEVCAEAQNYDLNRLTDLSIYINGEKIASYSIKGDFGGKRGKYAIPEWWPLNNTQYGRPITIEVRDDGVYIADNYDEWISGNILRLTYQKVSDIDIKNLDLHQDSLTLRIAVDKNAEHRGGMNLFGEKFGNYAKTITLGLEYTGEKIYQPTISEIIDNPEKFEHKTVLLTVHPGGWGCPARKSTPIPAGFSRSATMIYDNTGCLYGSGNIITGEILSPEIHPINIPGNEMIVIEGKIKLDRNKTPFLLPVGGN